MHWSPRTTCTEGWAALWVLWEFVGHSLHVQVAYNGVLKYGGEKAFLAAL